MAKVVEGSRGLVAAAVKVPAKAATEATRAGTLVQAVVMMAGAIEAAVVVFVAAAAMEEEEC